MGGWEEVAEAIAIPSSNKFRGESLFPRLLHWCERYTAFYTADLTGALPGRHLSAD